MGRSYNNCRTSFASRLDFMPPASVCRSMKKHEKDQIAELFADLTGRLEDAAEVAVAGQSSTATLQAPGRLASDLQQQLATCSHVLKHIGRRLQT